MNKLKCLYLLFLLSTTSSFALYQDTKELSDEAQAQLREFSKDNKQLSSEQKISRSAQVAREAHLFCAGKINGPVGETISSLMKVGLHNYCDQYEDDESFCNCIGEVTYENKLKKEDLEDFQEKIKKENLKNLGYTSMKALVNDRSLSIKYDITVGRTDNFEPMKEGIACSHPKDFYESIKEDCSEEEITQLENGYNLYTSECKNCTSSQLLQNLPNDMRSSSFNSAERFISLGGHMASQQASELIDKEFFKTSKLKDLSGMVGNGKFSTINEVQLNAIIDTLAKRIFVKNEGYLNPGYPAKVMKETFTKYEEVGLIETLDKLHLFQSDIFYINGKQGSLDVREDVENRVADYISYFEKKINPSLIFTPKKFKSIADVKASLNKIFEKQMIINLKNSCTRTQDTFKKSCKALRDNVTAFDFGKYAKSVRDNNFGEDKFKFDQLYCVAQNKNSSLISEKVMVKEEGWFGKKYEKVYALQKSSNPIDYSFSEYLDGKDGKLHSFDWGIGVESDSILAASGGRVSIELLHKVSRISGYDFAQSKGKESNEKSLFKPLWDPRAENFSPDYYSNNLRLQPSFRPTSSVYSLTPSRGPKTRPTKNALSADDSLIAVTKTEVEQDLGQQFKAEANKGLSDMKSQVSADIANNTAQLIAVETEKLESEHVAPKAIIVEEDSAISSQLTKTVITPEEKAESNVSSKRERVETNNIVESENLIKTDETAPSFFNTFTGGKDTSLEKRFENLKSSLSSTFGKKPDEKKDDDKEESKQRVVDVNNPIENSFKPESKGSTSSEGSSLEIEKMKLELEKMKLELAKSEQEIELKKLEDSKEKAALAKKANIEELVNNQLSKPSTKASEVTRVASKSGATNSANAKKLATASRASTDLPRSNVASSNSAPRQASQGPSQSSISTKASKISGASKSSISQTSASEGSGTLLTAVSATNEQISKVIDSPASNLKSVKSVAELETYDQEVLAKYYENGTQIVLESQEANEEGLDTLKLEKDEQTGLISVVKLEPAKVKRAPASKIDKPIERKPRKVFSYDEFKTILDSSREE
ncbi:hypothetical protein [Halobacteriovorax sp. HLS]|uniref:hypothetical protein n=1 Tax=Halobacteriovorax sp. HLS TaxID=2234000 RepID=UPI000FD8FAC7|nr:hypothetical protein [Halobacteriovorax sp. HLS]